MALATDLKRLINASPERPVPAAGDVARLSWAPGPDSVAVDLASEQDGSALFTVHVPAELAASTLKSATTALVRGMGIDPTQAGAAADARAKMGDEAFARQLGLMVRQPLFALAVMRTQVLPFLAPQHVGLDLPVEGEEFTFQTRCLLRPRAELTSYEPVEVAVPADEKQRDAQAAELLDRCADALATRLTAEPPAGYVDLLRNEMANRFAENVEREGTSWETYVAAPDFSMDAFKAQMTEAARTSLRRGMALDALAAHLGVMVEESDLLAVAGQVAAGYERVALDAMLQSGQLPQLCEVSRRGKAQEWLLSTAKAPTA
ncbi:MAG: hypothetical protein KHY83_02850 [Coriobacteriia bacterium]|nr:hypothetical protein [Coriobacteriia bacterium]MBS5477587.1 hypothetical protein [Coriobacteriia bacterium]